MLTDDQDSKCAEALDGRLVGILDSNVVASQLS